MCADCVGCRSTKHLQHLTVNVPPQTGYPPRSASHVHLTSNSHSAHSALNSPSSTSNNNNVPKGRSPVNGNANGNGRSGSDQPSQRVRRADGGRAPGRDDIGQRHATTDHPNPSNTTSTSNLVDTSTPTPPTTASIDRAVSRALAALPCALPTSAEQRNALFARDAGARKWDAERVLCAGCDRWVDIVDPGTLLRLAHAQAQASAKQTKGGQSKGSKKGSGKSGSGKGVVKDEDGDVKDVRGEDEQIAKDGDDEEQSQDAEGDAEGEDGKEDAEGEDEQAEDPYERWIRHRETCRAERCVPSLSSSLSIFLVFGSTLR